MTEAQAQSLERALAHHRAGELEAAEALYRRVLAGSPRHPDALHLLGVVAHQRGQHEQAAVLFVEAIKVNPGVAHYHHNLGEALFAIGRADQAVTAYRTACALDPANGEAYNNFGIALQALGRLPEAISAFEQARRVTPRSVEAHFNLAAALHDSGRLEEAIEGYRQALALAPDDPEIHSNLGVALQGLNRAPEALAAFEQAIALRPDFAEAHANRGMALLLTGRFEEGWREYAWRFSAAQRWDPRRLAQPQWRGEAFPGRTLLVHTEQGIGDVIQFVRCLPAVRAKGGRVLLACEPVLRPLLADIPGVDELVDAPAGRPAGVEFDLHIALLDVPGALGTTLATIPAQVPYLTADPGRCEAWRGRLPVDTYTVGLCWAGHPRHGNDRNRSMALAMFAPLADIVGVRFYSLQKGPAAQQISTSPARLLLDDYTNELNDFADTAALLSELDLILSVDTAVAHLAGALAKPVWTLLPYAPDWRWLLEREDSPWYPTMRLFRQPQIGDWQSVMDRVAGELRTVVARWSPRD